MLHGIKTNVLTTGTRAIAALSTAVLGLICTAEDADTETFPLNTPVLITDVRGAIAKAGSTGTLAAALGAIADQSNPAAVIIRVAASGTTSTQNANAIGTVTTGGYAGAQALLVAEARTGVRPRIIGAPGLDTAAVTAALVIIAKKLRGMVYAAAIGANVSAVVTGAGAYGDRELMLIWPNFTGGFAGDAVARAMGLRAQIDQQVGWHKSISNVEVGGVTGIVPDVYWALDDETSDAGVLNTGNVTTLIRNQGFRFWGNRTCSSEPLFAFEVATRTSQVLQDEIEKGLIWAVDKPLTLGLIRDMLDTINARFRALIAQGRLIGAKAWYDPANNIAADLNAGKLVIDYDFTPAAPLEGLTLNQRITDKYYADFAALLQAA